MFPFLAFLAGLIAGGVLGVGLMAMLYMASGDAPAPEPLLDAHEEALR